MAARKTKPARHQWTLKTVHDRCEEVGECWIWQQCCNNHGNPQARIQGPPRSVRVFIYDELLRKGRPANSVIRAKCGDAKCCNPEHLTWTTRAIVIKEALKRRGPEPAKVTLKRRQNVIAQGGIVKLDMAKAEEIRRRRDEPSKVLADEFGVKPESITAIWRGERWRPVGPASIFNLGG